MHEIYLANGHSYSLLTAPTIFSSNSYQLRNLTWVSHTSLIKTWYFQPKLADSFFCNCTLFPYKSGGKHLNNRVLAPLTTWSSHFNRGVLNFDFIIFYLMFYFMLCSIICSAKLINSTGYWLGGQLSKLFVHFAPLVFQSSITRETGLQHERRSSISAFSNWSFAR